MPLASNEPPILEFDSTSVAIIEPSSRIERIDIAEHCVVCFFQDVIDSVRRRGAREVDFRSSELGKHPIYEIERGGKRLAFFHPGVGAPLCASMLEEVIALGCRKFVSCGGAGALDNHLSVGHIVVPSAAIRDEGVSYHYLPPGREVQPDSKAMAAIDQTLKSRGLNYLVGKTWTIDAIYRETRGKLERRRQEGCLTVEMETAAFFAVARFRNVQFAQILYAGDDLSGKWDHRDWHSHSIREDLFWLAADASLLL